MLYDFPKGEKGMTYGNPVARHREDSPKLHDDWLDYPIHIRWHRLSEYPQHRTVVHWHDDIELVVVREGRMMYNVNGTAMLLGKDEGMFVNAQQTHFSYPAGGWGLCLPRCPDSSRVAGSGAGNPVPLRGSHYGQYVPAVFVSFLQGVVAGPDPAAHPEHAPREGYFDGALAGLVELR